MSAHTDRTPDAFAAGYLATMVGYWTAPLGLAVRRMAPVAFPGAPPEALLGFTTEGGAASTAAGDDTATDGANNSFHEVGYFQTEAGLATGPAPNPDPSASYNNWGRLASSALVVQLLGRPATMVAGAWATAVDDQAAVGLANLRAHAAATAALLPAAIRPAAPGSLWNVVCAFMGFSSGDGGAAATINRYATALAAVDEPARWGALIHAVIGEASAGALPGTAGQHGQPAYDVLRTWQKLATGAALAQQTGGDVAWFATGYGANNAAAEAAIDNAAFGRATSVVAGFAPAAGVSLAHAASVLSLGTGLWRLLAGEWPWQTWKRG